MADVTVLTLRLSMAWVGIYGLLHSERLKFAVLPVNYMEEGEIWILREEVLRLGRRSVTIR